MTILKENRWYQGLPTAAVAVFSTGAVLIPGASAHATNTAPKTTTVDITSSIVHPMTAVPQVTTGQLTYTIQKGDTLTSIARAAGVSVTTLRELNKLSSDHIVAGRKLVLPGVVSAVGYQYHLIARGDTLFGLASKYKTTVDQLRQFNPSIGNNGLIYAGRKIKVPSEVSILRTPAEAKAHKTSATTKKRTRTVSQPATQSAEKGLSISDKKTQGAQPNTKATKPAKKKNTQNTFLGRTYPDAVVLAAQTNRDSLAKRSLPSRSQMRKIIAKKAASLGVDPALALAISYQESGHQMKVVSPANAIGTMQVIPSSGQWASQLSRRNLDLLDPHDNVTAGLLILRANMRYFKGDEAKAIAGYYQGAAGVERNGMYADTKRYVANVQSLKSRFQ